MTDGSGSGPHEVSRAQTRLECRPSGRTACSVRPFLFFRAAGNLKEEVCYGNQNRHRDRPVLRHEAHHRDRRDRRCGRPVPGAVRQLQGQGGLPPAAGEQAPRRQADPGHRHQPHPRRRGQDHHHGGSGGRHAEAGQKHPGGPAGAVSRPRVRREGRRRRRRLCPGGAYGGHQPPLHRRLPRHRRGQQPAGGHAGQPHPAGQRPGHRRQAHHLEALRGHERPPAAEHRGRTGRPDAGRSPGGRL